jgi:hypothetical protein
MLEQKETKGTKKQQLTENRFFTQRVSRISRGVWYNPFFLRYLRCLL